MGVHAFEIFLPDSDYEDTFQDLSKMRPNRRHSSTSSAGNAKPDNKEPLGKLVFKQDDLNSLKCLVAAGMTRRRVECEPAPPTPNGKGNGRNAPKTTFTLNDGSAKLTDPFAIAWFLGVYDNKASKTQDKFGAFMMQWKSFASTEIKPFLTALLREGHMKRRDFDHANNVRKIRLMTSLDTLNQTLMKSRFLTGNNKPAIADVILCVDLLPLFDKEWAPTDGLNVYLKDILTKDYKFIKEWFRLVTSSKAFSTALLQFKVNLTTNTTVTKKPRKKSTTSQSEVTSKGDGVDGNAAAKGKGRKYRVSSTESANEIKSERVDMSGLAKRPLKILCLHGYRQNDITFREKLGAFRKMVGKYCEFTFVTAPHPVLPMGHEDINQDQRGWWFSRENDYFKADDATDCDKGFESSLGMIERTFQLHGPFDGIFAFSQGAALASLMCLMKERKELAPAIDFKFTILSHPGGHFVPAKVQQKQSYFRFLHKVAQLRPEQPEAEEDKKEVAKEEATEGGSGDAKPEDDEKKTAQGTDLKADVPPPEKEGETSSTSTDENQNKEKIKTEVSASSEAPQQVAA